MVPESGRSNWAINSGISKVNSYLLSPVEFLISTLFDLYIMVVMLRFLLQWVKADFYNPISQFIVKVTTPTLHPLRRFIPGWRGVDLASVVLMLGLQMISVTILLLLRGGGVDPVVLLFWSLAELVSLSISVFLFAVIIQAVISWINPMNHYNPIAALLHSLTAPLLRPAQRLIPPIGGLDLSPIAVIIGLQILKMLLVPPLRYLALG